ncbi:MAG: alpha/beta hydrolase [Candidatus Baltobacteraceae bacterium]
MSFRIWNDLLGLRGSLEICTLRSEALASGVLGDPIERFVGVYLPPEYDPYGSQRYASIYCLHGHASSLAKTLSAGPWERNLVQQADAAMVAGLLPPAILVLVDGATRLGGSQYVDSLQNGDVARHIALEIVDEVDRRYRSIQRPSARGIVGKSSGGFGALHLAANFPGRFSALASIAGDAYFRLTMPMFFPAAQRTLERYGGDPAAFVEGFRDASSRRDEDYSALFILASAAAYSPRSQRAFDVEFPFDLRSGEINDEVFARWLSFDPVEYDAEKRELLAQLSLCYLDAGRRDEYGLDIAARTLAHRLRESGVRLRSEEFPGGHRNTTERSIGAITALLEVLDR